MKPQRQNINLTAELRALECDSAFSVIEIVSKKTHTKTEKVMLKAANGIELGPFIRKEFDQKTPNTNAYKRLFEEQKNLRRLNCVPYILGYYEYGQKCSVILEFVEGITLDKFVKQATLSIPQISKLFTEICKALDQLHTHFETPLIHRDIKPSNIIVNNGKVMLIDFGIARFFRNDKNPDTTKLGTVAFAPPEQYGFGQTCIQSDIYALGMVLYFMLTKTVSSTTLRDNPTFDNCVPKNLQQPLLRATSFDPNARYSSAIEFAKDFERATLVAEAKGAGENNNTTGMKVVDTTTHMPPGVKFQAGQEKQKSEKWCKFKIVAAYVNNIVVILLWALLMFGCASMVLVPNANQQSASFVNRAANYLGIGGVFFTTCAFLLLNKTLLKRKYTWAAHFNWKFNLSIVGVAVLLIVVFYGVCAVAS